MLRNDKEAMRLEKYVMLAEAWNARGIHYLVLNGIQGYPERIGRDLDVLVDQSATENAVSVAREALESVGFETAITPSIWVVKLMAYGPNLAWDQAVLVDFLPEVDWRGISLVRQAKPLFQIGPFWFEPWASWAKRVLKVALGGDVKRAWEGHNWFLAHPEWLPRVRENLLSIVGDPVGNRLWSSLQNECSIADLQHVMGAVRRRLVLDAFRKQPLSFAWGYLKAVRKRVFCRFVRSAPIVALVGPDGSGKSSVAKRLAEHRQVFDAVVVRHWRPGVMPSLRSLLGKSSIDANDLVQFSPPRRTPGKWDVLRVVYYGLDYLVGYWVRDRRDTGEGRLVVYDRHAIDMAVDPLRYGLNSGKWARLMATLIPRPDLVILLCDEPERIYARKPELPIDEIRRQLHEWLRLAEEGEVDAIIPVSGAAEEVAQRVREFIMEAFIEINDGEGVRTPNAGGVVLSKLGLTRSGKGYPYKMFCGAASRRWLIPRRRGLWFPSLRLYTPHRLAGWLRKGIMFIGSNRGRSVWLEDLRALDERVAEILRCSDLHYAFYLSGQGAHQKLTGQVMSSSGQVLAYVKIAEGPSANGSLRCERLRLSQLSTRVELEQHLPKVAGWFCWDAREVLVTSAGPGRRGPNGFGRPHMDFLSKLRKPFYISMPLCASPMWKEILEGYEAAQAKLSLIWKARYTRAIEILEKRLKDKDLCLSLAHRDFVPWNTRLNKDGSLYVFDWEFSHEGWVASYDTSHFLFMSHILLRRSIAPYEIVRLCRSYNVPPLCFLLYLVDVSLLYHRMLIARNGTKDDKTLSEAGRLFDLLGDWCA